LKSLDCELAVVSFPRVSLINLVICIVKLGDDRRVSQDVNLLLYSVVVKWVKIEAEKQVYLQLNPSKPGFPSVCMLFMD